MEAVQVVRHGGYLPVNFVLSMMLLLRYVSLPTIAMKVPSQNFALRTNMLRHKLQVLRMPSAPKKKE